MIRCPFCIFAVKIFIGVFIVMLRKILELGLFLDVYEIFLKKIFRFVVFSRIMVYVCAMSVVDR